MRITLDDLIVDSSHLDRSTLLSDWAWLIGKRKQPIVVSAIGDAFLHDPVEGLVYWLDVGQGQCHKLTDNLEEFDIRLRDKEFALLVLQATLIVQLRQAGKTLAPGQVYSFKKPPVIGGDYILENFQAADIATHFSTSGRFHRQIKNLIVDTK